MNKPVWVTLGINPVSDQVIILGFARTQAKAKRNEFRATEDVMYRRSFLFSDNLGHDLANWFCLCGVTSAEADRLVRDVGETVAEMLDD